ncbi:MAG: tetratricopeptide repeat protein, partial [Gemmataceae bacterium]
CHAFMPYHPPRMEGIPEADFEIYQHVVMGIYRLQDLFLQRLVQLAGPDAAVMVVSDHGFHSDHLRPKFTPRVPAGITVWHRPQGIFAAAGPGFKQDELVYGARLLDVAPTILHWFGLPVGADMEGRVLEEVFANERPVEIVPTWEPANGRVRPRVQLGPDGGSALLKQFVELGYIDELPDDPGIAARETARENDWNMARALMHGQRYEEALPLLEACFHACPFRTDFAQMFASCQMQLGLLAEADATVDRARETFGRSEQADLVKASIAIQKEDFQGALEILKRVREKSPDEVDLQLMLARSYLALRHFSESEAAARHVLTADPHNAQAFLVLARIEIHSGQFDDAVESALDAISLQYGNPLGHFLLGAALCGRQRFGEAETALRKCLALAPDFVRARRLLTRVLNRLGRREEAIREEARSREKLEEVRRRDEMRLTAARSAAVAREKVRAADDAARRAEAEKREAELAAIEPLDLLVVSGLPRSGTSLMMQMLRAGGIEPMTDGKRMADEDNPEGYWEWEDVKKLPKNPRLIEQAVGKAVKVISALLPTLPPPHRYTVIYMVRPVEQVVDSQWAMLARKGANPRSERQHLIQVQHHHSKQIREALAKSERVKLLEVSYPELVKDPGPTIAKLAELLPGRFTPSSKVAACVKPSLYRHQAVGK